MNDTHSSIDRHLQGFKHELSPAHRAELERASAIDPVVIAERGYRTVVYAERDSVAALGLVAKGRDAYPGLLLPMFRATGEPIGAQFKPATPGIINGRSVKYLSARGQCSRLDVHPRNRARVVDPSVPLWITEGIKKADALTSRGRCVIALMGVYNWRNKLATLGDWEDIPLKGREIVLCFDADARKNPNVARAMVRLGRWLRSKGAARVAFLIVPHEVGGVPVKGADDYLAAGGTIEALLAAATTQAPSTEAPLEDGFSDARLAQTVADEVLADRFVWCKALGWLGWTGQRWAEVTEEGVIEAVRLFAISRYADVATAGNVLQSKGWLSMQAAPRLRAVVDLTKGIVEKPSDIFDADPDLLNTPAGVVDLKTRQLSPHDPDLLLTKITRGAYREGFRHPDWEAAISALPDGVRAWFQERIGQAITGRPTPDGLLVVMQGGGENGKSALGTDGVLPAMGDYGAPVSPKLISDRHEHSTERADLRGQRLLIAEELTEGRALNVTAIKQITDVSQIKARKVHKDNVTFAASHSLFVTTNYIPVVAETDHGTWRRLALVVFPYRFRKPHEPLIGRADRRGDPGLKQRIQLGAEGQHDAIVTWAVEGARRWYWRGMAFPPLPAEVDQDTAAWRRQADRILGFWHECLIADPNAGILTSDMFVAFNAWLKSSGHHEWSRASFHPQFRGHSETAKHRVAEGRPRRLPELSRAWFALGQEVPNQPVIYRGVRFRSKDEINENAKEIDDCAACADPQTNSSREPLLEKFVKGSAHSAHERAVGAVNPFVSDSYRDASTGTGGEDGVNL
jgi:P4 family phage/plasmid primase-like protien